MRYGLLGFDFQISIHALREEGDSHWGLLQRKSRRFLSTPSARRATIVVGGTTVGPAISIHALREEGDLQKGNVFVWVVPEISIHALREEGDPFHARFRRWKADFYPRPPRGGRLDGWNAGLLTKDISIHALREEGDPTDLVRSEFSVPISIHALREEGDPVTRRTSAGMSLFLSTPSARRAT